MISNYFDLLSEFIKTDFKHRYKSSVLGFMWMVLKPLALFSILYFVWNALMRTKGQSSLFLLSGVMMVGYFNDGITLGLNSLVNKAHIILKIDFPRDVVIFSSTLVSVINFLVNYLILLIFIAFSPFSFSVAGIVLSLFSILTLYILVLGVSFFISVWNIVAKDLRHIVELVLQMMFWATPVLYDISILPAKLQKVIWCNPLTHILSAFRKGLLDATNVSAGDFLHLGVVFAITVVVALAGYFYFRPKVKQIAEFF